MRCCQKTAQKKCQGQLIAIQSEPKTRNIVTFKEISHAFKMAEKECFFMVGQIVFKRKRGWPMGGSHSEPGTMVDVGFDVSRLYQDPVVATQCGFHFEGYSTDQFIQGVQHVDEILLMTQLWCASCVEKTFKICFLRIWVFKSRNKGRNCVW